MCCSAAVTINEMIKMSNNRLVTPSPIPSDEKHVWFAVDVEISSVPSPLDRLESKAEWKSLWYKKDDLKAQRNEVRDSARRMRQLDDTARALVEPSDQPREPSLARDPFTRGIEQRSCLERQRRKLSANRFIVQEAQKLRNDPNKLAAVARKHTVWASELAVEEAARDYFWAWHFENKSQKKRTASQMSGASSSPLERCVRMRMTMAQA